MDASDSYNDEGASCLEIMPYAPKVWNAFSCEVSGEKKGRGGRYRYTPVEVPAIYR